jgi:hypothetical protein
MATGASADERIKKIFEWIDSMQSPVATAYATAGLANDGDVCTLQMGAVDVSQPESGRLILVVDLNKRRPFAPSAAPSLPLQEPTKMLGRWVLAAARVGKDLISPSVVDVIADGGRFGFSVLETSTTGDRRIEWEISPSDREVSSARVFNLAGPSPNTPVFDCRFKPNPA